MALWPATPRVPLNRSSAAATGSAQKNTAAAARASPASTTGETAADASMPTTPANATGIGTVDESIHRKPGKTTWDGLTGGNSGSWRDGSVEYAAAADSDFAVPVNVAAVISTPEAKGSSQNVEGGRNMPGSATSFYGSPHKIEKEANDKRRKVIRKPCEPDDPFLEKSPATGAEARPGSTTHASDRGDLSDAKSPDKASSVGTPFRPRRDREIEEVSSDNAQAVFPPNACVFVANLVSTSSDEQLQKAVEKTFSRFGKVYVKIKRDPRGMPFAFAQYENVEDSNRAIIEGRGMMINGRQCRTERAKVNRTLYLVRVLGGPISEEQAREVLAGSGDLEKIWHCTLTEKEFYRLPDGIWVTFAFFQDARDAQSQFKDHHEYRLEQPEGPYPMRLSRGSPLRNGAVYTTLNLQTTVCISNLPGDINPSQIREMFAHVGGCGEVEIVSRPPRTDVNGQEVFAFAEFSSESQAREVCRDGYQIDEYQLRVEYGNLAEMRAASGRVANQYGSPRGRRGGGHDGPKASHREQCIARGVASGLPPQTVMHILEGTGLGASDPFAAPLHASAYGPPYMPQAYSGGYGNSVGNGEAGSWHLYPSGPLSANPAGYPYAPFPSGPFFPFVPGGNVFGGVNEQGGRSSTGAGGPAGDAGA